MGPSYTRPDLPLPEHWHTTHDAAAVSPQSLVQWWAQFDDAALGALIDQAFVANPDSISARAALRASRARLRVAASAWSPEIAASASVSGVKSGESKLQEAWQAGFDASWEIDLFGGTRRSVEGAAADTAAAAATLENTRASLAAEVGLNYVSFRASQARLGIARRNLASQEETLQLADWRMQAGLASSLDVEQARTNTEQTRAQIPTLLTGIETALNRLAVLVGNPPGRLQSALADGALPTVPERLAVGVPADTIRRRPDVMAAERTLAAETARVGVAESALYPALQLSGSVGLEALTLGGLSGRDAVVRTLAAAIRGVLFDGGRLRAQVDLQDAVREQSLQSYRRAVLTALEEVENALVALRNSSQRRDALQAASTAARNASLLARNRYESGLIDFRTVLDTERSLLSTEDALASAEADRVTALIQLYKALGGGWSGAGIDGSAHPIGPESNGNAS